MSLTIPPGVPDLARLVPGLANLDHVASAVESVVRDGGAVGCRAIDLRVWDGIDVRVLPDRGFDLGAAWFGGVPLAWTSVVGEVPPLDRPRGLSWLEAFGGGLLTTCGLHHVGDPAGEQPLHGSFSQRMARDVRIERRLEDGHAVIEASAAIFDGDALDGGLELVRSVRTRTGEGLLEVEDLVRNVASRALAAPILYHVNFGAPLWGAGAKIALASDRIVSADAGELPRESWLEAGAVGVGEPRSGEHLGLLAVDGWARATLRSPATGIELELRWEVAGLPRLQQWIHPAAGAWALALEPANCLEMGTEAHLAPVLGPGESRRTRFEIAARRSGPAR